MSPTRHGDARRARQCLCLLMGETHRQAVSRRAHMRRFNRRIDVRYGVNVSAFLSS